MWKVRVRRWGLFYVGRVCNGSVIRKVVLGVSYSHAHDRGVQAITKICGKRGFVS